MDAEKGYKYLARKQGPFPNFLQRGFPFCQGGTINGPIIYNGLSVQAFVFFLRIPLVKKQGIASIEKCICHIQRLALLPKAVLKGPIVFLLATPLQDRPKGQPSANRQLPPTANRHPPPTIANRQPRPTANCQPLPTATNHPSPIASCHQLPPTAANHPPPTDKLHQPPTANRHQRWLNISATRGGC